MRLVDIRQPEGTHLLRDPWRERRWRCLWRYPTRIVWANVSRYRGGSLCRDEHYLREVGDVGRYVACEVFYGSILPQVNPLSIDLPILRLENALLWVSDGRRDFNLSLDVRVATVSRLSSARRPYLHADNPRISLFSICYDDLDALVLTPGYNYILWYPTC